MEKRVIISHQEAVVVIRNSRFISTSYLEDNYTGISRIRSVGGEITEEEYSTPCRGIVRRLSSKLVFYCNQSGRHFTDVWLEWKWTHSCSRWEVEFEGQVPEEFRDRESIAGWSILLN